MTTSIPPEGITARSDTTEALGALARKERHSFGARSSPRSPWTPPPARSECAACSGVFAAGRIVNPLTARNQLVGGMT